MSEKAIDMDDMANVEWESRYQLEYRMHVDLCLLDKFSFVAIKLDSFFKPLTCSCLLVRLRRQSNENSFSYEYWRSKFECSIGKVEQPCKKVSSDTT